MTELDAKDIQQLKNQAPQALNLKGDIGTLTEDLINTYSVSGSEKELADLIAAALSQHKQLELTRDGNALIARTNWAKAERIILAGHLDTVPLPDQAGSLGTLPASWQEEEGQQLLYGRGAVDMKGGLAVQLALAAALTDAAYDITFVFYDQEEVASNLSGLGRLMRRHQELLTDAAFAVLLEPTLGKIEGGCNGSLRFWIHTTGLRAHSGRSWVGKNAIHALQPLLQILGDYQPATYEVEGLAYREGLNAVQIAGGVAGNVIPDRASLHINYRFAPNKSLDQAIAHMQEVFSGYSLDFVDQSAAARPGLDSPIAQSLLQAVGQQALPKYGWTDVARFSQVGIPAVNFGPGDALLAHADMEHLSLDNLQACYRSLKNWLQTGL